MDTHGLGAPEVRGLITIHGHELKSVSHIQIFRTSSAARGTPLVNEEWDGRARVKKTNCTWLFKATAYAS